MAQLTLKIVTPEKEIFNDQVEEVTARTSEGEVGILPNHASLLTQVVPGELSIKTGKENIMMAIGSGLLQMANNTLVIATDMAMKESEIDEKLAEEAKKRAEEAIEQTQTGEEYALALANLEKALAQLKVKRHHTKARV